MAEIIYQYPFKITSSIEASNIRWLNADELGVFNKHLDGCGQRPLSTATWDMLQKQGTVYCGLFVGDEMVARACVEKYSDSKWEVADVRTVKHYRTRGFAFETSHFVLSYILAHGRIATIRTEEDNWTMQRVIAKLGFTPIL